jgi:hypothetical protein
VDAHVAWGAGVVDATASPLVRINATALRNMIVVASKTASEGL